MRRNRTALGSARRAAVAGLLVLLGVGGCSSANPSNRRVAGPEAPVPGSQASWPIGGGPETDAPPPIVASRPTVSGVTTDPGTRYLSMGSVGALTVETPPAPPPPPAP